MGPKQWPARDRPPIRPPLSGRTTEGGARRVPRPRGVISQVGHPKTTRALHYSPRSIDTGSHPRLGVYFWLASGERAITPDSDPREDDSRSCGFCARRLPGSIVQFWLLHEHDSRPFSASRVTRSELRRCRRGRCTIRLYGHVMEVDPRLNLKTACMFHKGSFVRHGKR
jgi:hypothetical protein